MTDPRDAELVDALAELDRPTSASSSGVITLPLLDSFVPVAAQLVGVVAAQADRACCRRGRGPSLEAVSEPMIVKPMSVSSMPCMILSAIGESACAELAERVQRQRPAEDPLVELHRLPRVVFEADVGVAVERPPDAPSHVTGSRSLAGYVRATRAAGRSSWPASAPPACPACASASSRSPRRWQHGQGATGPYDGAHRPGTRSPTAGASRFTLNSTLSTSLPGAIRRERRIAAGASRRSRSMHPGVQEARSGWQRSLGGRAPRITTRPGSTTVARAPSSRMNDCLPRLSTDGGLAVVRRDGHRDSRCPAAARDGARTGIDRPRSEQQRTPLMRGAIQ